jgi:cell pole-organizing protein PopZ
MSEGCGVAMAKVSAAQEPSMEEILASIRRIISEDEAGIAPIKAADVVAPAAKLPSVAVSAADIDALFSARVQEITSHEIPSVELKAEHQPEPARPEPVRSEAPRTEASRPAPAAPALAEPRMLRPSLPPLPEPRRPAPQAEKPAPRPSFEPEPPAAAPLVSAATDAAVSSAFGDLANTVLSSNARTLDDLVKEMLRPMLKTWLDTNLPPLVERLVREEIERLSRRR